MKTKNTTINISGMSCSGCANKVEKSLSDIGGIQEVKVDLDENTATVTYSAGKVSSTDFKQAVEKAGYRFEGIK